MSDTEKYDEGSVDVATVSSRPALCLVMLQDGAAGSAGVAPCSVNRTGAACSDDWMWWEACKASLGRGGVFQALFMLKSQIFYFFTEYIVGFINSFYLSSSQKL